MLATTIVIGLVLAPVLISYVVEALRSPPATPERLPWAPDIAIRYVTVDGLKIRYIVAGHGPALVLLHTLRTQLDMFQKVVPVLSQHFRVYALDYPGHGYSDIARADYTVDFFVRSVAGFLDRLNIENAVLAGESIGGTIALLLAARKNQRVRAVVAINPYDYDAGRGLRRSSTLANVLFGVGNIPILGATAMRLRQRFIENRVLQGGVKRKQSLPEALALEMYRVGNRKGHYRAFMSLVRHWPGWEQARTEYTNIEQPVLLLYGDADWSRTEEREADARDIPGAQLKIVEGGHFLSLENPAALTDAVEGMLTREPVSRASQG